MAVWRLRAEPSSATISQPSTRPPPTSTSATERGWPERAREAEPGLIVSSPSSASREGHVRVAEDEDVRADPPRVLGRERPVADVRDHEAHPRHVDRREDRQVAAQVAVVHVPPDRGHGRDRSSERRTCGPPTSPAWMIRVDAREHLGRAEGRSRRGCRRRPPRSVERAPGGPLLRIVPSSSPAHLRHHARDRAFVARPPGRSVPPGPRTLSVS